MKLLRWGPKGQEKPGILDAEGRVRDLSGAVDDIAGAVLAPEGLARLAAIDPATLPLAPADARIGPCVGRVPKFLAIGLNYADHAAEAGMPLPKEPVLFMKATSCIAGPNDDVPMPRGSTKLDWEVELGIVIGTRASYVSREDALSHVAGYCTVNDISERSFQIDRGGTWDKGKGCDGFGPIGPWLVTRDEVPNPQDLRLTLSVDGVVRQNGTTRTMIFDVVEIVSYVSQFITLEPGDVITTGTPPGVGMGAKPDPIFLKVGETMRVAVEGLGEQVQTVVAPR
jgi:2-keto-4-pentenoate hydratase/2-oxohepta-3-ene-1,7-dioic acid hydratase in catechol pathway